MIEKLRKYFKNKKAETAFKKAGPGYRLDDTPTQPGNSSSKESASSSRDDKFQHVRERTGLTEESRQAAAAALARLDKQKNVANPNKSLTTIRARVRQEMEAERMAKLYSSAECQFKTIKETSLEATPILAVQGVFFQCPLVGPDILTKEEWNKKLKEFLYAQLEEEKGLVACLIIQTLNKSKEKIDACVDTIIKYFENILKNPTDEKYRKIRLKNKTFQEKVKPIEGALLIFEAAGFELKELPHLDGKEDFLVYPSEKLPDAPECFEILIDGLKNAEPITLDLYRNMQVLLPSQARERNELPPSFFQLTAEEIKKEQSYRTETVEKNQTLRTKAMRERDEIHEIRKYRFALVRIRFPDNIHLQGTFGVYEKACEIVKFVTEALEDENLNFTLTTPDGQHLKENLDMTLVDLKLVPASLLIFASDMSKETYLKPEILMLLESFSVSQ